eukprot:Partr_v1_DN23923_c0_g2_i2_m49059 putative cleavage and polyadenylation specificity factor
MAIRIFCCFSCRIHTLNCMPISLAAIWAYNNIVRPSGEGDVNTIMTDVLVPAGVIADFESVRIGRWYKHTAESIYPYLPPHIKQPREIRDIMLVKLPPSMVFGVPKNLKVAAVPLFEVYENHSRYGPIIANVPFMLSQFEFENVEATLQPSKQLQ